MFIVIFILLVCNAKTILINVFLTECNSLVTNECLDLRYDARLAAEGRVEDNRLKSIVFQMFSVKNPYFQS